MGSGSGRKPDRWGWLRRLGIAALALLTFMVLSVAFCPMPVDTASAKVEWVTEELGALRVAARTYRDRTGHWPASVATLRQARLLPGRIFPTEPEPFEDIEDRDPWGRPFVLTPKGAALEIRSLGDDGPDPDDDVAILVEAESPAGLAPVPGPGAPRVSTPAWRRPRATGPRRRHAPRISR